MSRVVLSEGLVVLVVAALLCLAVRAVRRQKRLGGRGR